MQLSSTGRSIQLTGPLDPALRARMARFANALETKADSTGSTSTFAGELASVIEKYLGDANSGAELDVQVVNGSGQDSGARQIVVTVKDPNSTDSTASATISPDASTTTSATSSTTAATAAADTTPELDPAQGLMYSGTVQYVPQSDTDPQTAAPTNEYDAYWATQPPEVQVLRDIPSEADRTTKAQELAAQGYSIDVPIMVWQWDPLMTMRAREMAGYTWVPSANNAPVELGPGMNFPGMTPYDAGNPPAGSIKVSTDWAKGLEETSIWWRPGIFTDADPSVDSSSSAASAASSTTASNDTGTSNTPSV